ncbi:nucleoside hydrolase [Loktanella sp. IMCC34160]|uniref:nucleoside hydrolase n=1 Tax=Loktanella sp. IMCC34160 TaxID=2510646 RepID=UPI0013EDDF0B|nr:nucleoside hydrolase [Loktanella sp. IMCC34160]
MSQHRVIIDCDPGHDDFAAIALAAQSKSIQIEAIIAVNGNAPLSHTVRNALSIAAALDLDCPVHAGAELPFLHRYAYPTEFHGETGLDSSGAMLPNHDRGAEQRHGALEIIQRVRAAPGEITIVALGPMTDIALALTLDPGIAPLVREIVFMGGALSGGNVTSQAEFNIWADPHAAAIVLAAGVRTTMFGLDVTNRAWLTMDELASLREGVDTPNPLADILQFYAEGSGDVRAGRTPGPALHDPCPIAWLIQPELFEVEALPVSVCCTTGDHFGTTYSDRRAWRDEAAPTISVATGIDRDGFAGLLTPALHMAAKQIAEKTQLPCTQSNGG